MTLFPRRRFLRTVLLSLASGLAGGLSFSRAVLKAAAPEPAAAGACSGRYRTLHRTGELNRRAEALWQRMAACDLCPRQCGANRLAGEEGFCGASARLEVSSFHPHFGEERPLVLDGGSGTIFLTHCGLRCVFCINWQVSHAGVGSVAAVDRMAEMMLDLQRQGCLNINFVTPTHYSPHILLAVDRAAARGLRLPVVYNTCGWERVEILEMLDGVVDIYLPDFKYADSKMAERFSSGADTYPALTQASLLEMHRQVGTARPDNIGRICRGLMVRHLVMPNNVGGSCRVIDWIADHLPRDTYVNLMSQYRPLYRAAEFPEIDRRITRGEFAEVVAHARRRGLTNLDIQEMPLWR